MPNKEQLDKLNSLLDKHNGDVEVEGCIVDPHYDVLAFKRKGDEIIVVVDDMEECDIVDKPLGDFSEKDIDEIIFRAIDF